MGGRIENEDMRIRLKPGSFLGRLLRFVGQGRFVVTPRRLGLPEGMSYDNIERLIEALEGPLHR